MQVMMIRPSPPRQRPVMGRQRRLIEAADER